MYPHERSLVDRLANQRFVLLGVNSDEDPEELKTVMVTERISWQSWWDESKTGPIQTQWHVNKRPTVHILDWNGVIRFKNLELVDVDEAIDGLLKELEDQSAD